MEYRTSIVCCRRDPDAGQPSEGGPTSLWMIGGRRDRSHRRKVSKIAPGHYRSHQYIPKECSKTWQSSSGRSLQTSQTRRTEDAVRQRSALGPRFHSPAWVGSIGTEIDAYYTTIPECDDSPIGIVCPVIGMPEDDGIFDGKLSVDRCCRATRSRSRLIQGALSRCLSTVSGRPSGSLHVAGHDLSHLFLAHSGSNPVEIMKERLSTAPRHKIQQPRKGDGNYRNHQGAIGEPPSEGETTRNDEKDGHCQVKPPSDRKSQKDLVEH